MNVMNQGKGNCHLKRQDGGIDASLRAIVPRYDCPVGKILPIHQASNTIKLRTCYMPVQRGRIQTCILK